jgi:predicted class III extradiol MEMO1 family dioxygenase
MSQSDSSTPCSPAPFNAGFPHHQRPKLRPVRGFAAQGQGPDGQNVPVLGLADARQISEKVVFMSPAVQVILPLMDGTRDIDQIVGQVGRGLTREMMQQMVAQLDDAALLDGPNFDALLRKTRAEFDASPVLPPASSAQFADAAVDGARQGQSTDEQKAAEGPDAVRKLFDQWMATVLEKAENPSFDRLPKAIVAPHIDYGRGWMNYAAIYGRLRVCDRPDRVVVLGTNHFGMGTGVVGCDKGFQTPLGTCEVDTGLASALRGSLGEKLFEHRFDHEREHSVELQIMWIQHVFGKDDAGRYPRVFGALVHDPVINNGESYDGNGIGLEAFVNSLKSAISAQPGRTLVISSADLSHCGPAFGDQRPLAGEDPEVVTHRNSILQHDMQMLELLANNKPGDLLGALAWQQNHTRWCSVGNLVASMRTVEPTEVKLLNYAAAMDQQGMTLVSHAAMAMW